MVKSEDFFTVVGLIVIGSSVFSSIMSVVSPGKTEDSQKK